MPGEEEYCSNLRIYGGILSIHITYVQLKCWFIKNLWLIPHSFCGLGCSGGPFQLPLCFRNTLVMHIDTVTFWTVSSHMYTDSACISHFHISQTYVVRIQLQQAIIWVSCPARNNVWRTCEYNTFKYEPSWVKLTLTLSLTLSLILTLFWQIHVT